MRLDLGQVQFLSCCFPWELNSENIPVHVRSHLTEKGVKSFIIKNNFISVSDIFSTVVLIGGTVNK